MRKHWINNEWVDSSRSDHIDVEDPATQEILDTVQAGTEADVNRAVDAAQSAFDDWRRLSAVERAHMLHAAANKIDAHWDEIVHLLTLEQGKPIPENEEELEWVRDTLRYYAELGRNYRGRVIPSGEPSQLNMVIKEPYGVVGAIVPWNYPLLLLAWKLAPALAAGNVTIIKPSEMTPLSTLLMVEKCFNHFPPGVVNCVTGYGNVVGEALVKHPDVPVIAFTGSLETGQRISTVAAPMMKHLHLELGGKDAFVVAPDVDIEASAKALTYSALLNCGQVCTSTERVYVADSIIRDFTEAVVEEVKALRLGPGIEAATDIGPMVGESYRRKFEMHIANARERGAKILVGGKRPEALPGGYFYEPTILTNVNHDMLVMCEETFGPAIPLMPYRDFSQAVEYVNSSKFGLGAVLRTSDAHLAKIFMEEVKAGTIWINDPLTDNYAGPFGGMKMSGNARELGEEGLTSFMETKHVHWDFSADAKNWWYPY